MELKRDTLLQGGRYRIVESIGRGGFGITYLAEQVMAKRKVCIKEFFPKDYYKREGNTGSLTLSSDGFGEAMNKFKAKFIKEAQTIAALDHPNIIHIHDVFEENGTAYYVMDYIEGESLSELVKSNGAMSERDAAAYIKQVAAALEHIHDRKINHLDVKPGNIMVRREDNRAILIDFGLSKHYDAESGEATSTTPVGVSHGFAPMEQYKQGGVSKFSPETDIYSLGATLYYLVTGSVPPQAADIGKDGIGELPSELSTNVCVAIRKSMSYWKEDRPHIIKEFLALLDNKVVKPKPKKRRWWVWTLLLLFIVVLLMSIKDLFSNGDNSKEVATKGKTAYMPTNVTAPAPEESEPLDAEGGYPDAAYAEFAENECPDAESVDAEVEAPVAEAEVPAVEATETSAPYKVGDYYNRNGKEGVVFAVWDNGRHGKIVSLDETETRWDSRVRLADHYVINGTNTEANSDSDGKDNTDKVMSRADSQYFEACAWCRNKGGDWYLPAKDELKTISNNKSMINFTLAKYGTELNIFSYWSSTESEDNPGVCAWLVEMDDSGTRSVYKFGDCYVRAVSVF